MAFVLSSVSGNLISAASAGYAPTNSGDVSAIASAYQVVSATATQLYAGTAYLTSVNGAPVSASRAGQAANASMATSAYYDGTGRLISSLPDSAAVSSIASSYAESAMSSKADASALSSYALSSDVSGVIDTVSANSASWGGGATGEYVEKSAMEVAIGSANTAFSTAFAQGIGNSAEQGFAQGRSNSAKEYSFAHGNSNSANRYSFAQGNSNSAYTYSFVHGRNNSATNTAVVFGKYNLRGNGSTSTGDSAAFAIGDGTANTARHDLMLVTKDGEITMYSSTADTAGTGIMSSIRAISAAATGGGVDSATVSAIASSYAESAASNKLDTSAFNSGDFYSTANPSGFITGVDLSPYQTTADMSSYIPTSMSSDFQQVTGMSSYALSSDVSATVDLVVTQSANWGGSALALSAGPGVKLEKSGNTLVASTDETLLFSGSNSGMVATTLTESLSGFNSFKICFKPFDAGVSREWKEFSWAGSSDVYTVATYYRTNTENLAWYVAFQPNADGTTITPVANKLNVIGASEVQDRTQIYMYQVVGINRTAGV